MVDSEKKTIKPGDPKPKEEIQKRRKIPILKIVIDTNQLFTESASDLLNINARQAIEGSRRHSDLQIEWYIPEIVRQEREYRMNEAAESIMPYINKLERLLSHRLGIDRDILRERVHAIIDKQISELGLKPLSLDVSKVDWKKVMSDSVFRQAPFSPGKTEKGFRDAIICECFYQLLESSPKKSNICRVALLSNDGPLSEAVDKKTTSYNNVRILKSFEDVQNLINTLVSSATEEFINRIREDARKYFFSQDEKAGLYYSANIKNRIETEYGDKIFALPPGSEVTEITKWLIGPTSFVKKEKRRITWKTTVSIELKAFKYLVHESISSVINPIENDPMSPYELTRLRSGIPSIFDSNSNVLPTYDPNAPVLLSSDYRLSLTDLQRFQRPLKEKVLVSQGTITFYVHWSTEVLVSKKFRSSRIIGIEYIDTKWP